MKSMQDYIMAAKSAIEEIDVGQALEINPALWLDVREAGEIATTGRAKGAVHIPRGLLEANADPESPAADPGLTCHRGTERTIVVYCASGGRGALATRTLCEMGYNAKNMKGGMTAWVDAGAPVEHD